MSCYGCGVVHLCVPPSIDVASLSPANLFTKTANIKLMMISGEVFFIVCFVIFLHSFSNPFGVITKQDFG